MNRQIQTDGNKANQETEGRPSRPSVVARNKQNQLAKRTFFIITLLPMILDLGNYACAGCTFLAYPEHIFL